MRPRECCHLCPVCGGLGGRAYSRAVVPRIVIVQAAERPEWWPREPVFVVGAPRSGTTLVRVVLDRHPNLHVAGETKVLTRFRALFDEVGRDPARLRSALERWEQEGGRAQPEAPTAGDLHALLSGLHVTADVVLGAIVHSASAAVGKSRGGEKTPDHFRHVDRILADFPDASVVWVLRDPRGVVASELTLPAKWASRDPDAIVRGWVRSIEVLERAVKQHGDRVRVVQYESLLDDPRRVLGELLEQLSLPWSDTVIHSGTAPGGYRHGHSDPWGEPDPSGTERWRELLSPRDVALVEHVAHAAMKRMSYLPSTSGARLAGRLRSFRLRVRRRARRHTASS